MGVKVLQLSDVKSAIKFEINCASQSFISIGYYLKYVRDNELYIDDEYSDTWEFAQKEFGISKSSASRFMAINDKFSVEGNSTDILVQYKDFGSSKLAEMLTLSDDQVKEVTVSTTRAEIREMKQAEKVIAPAQQKESIPGQMEVDNYPVIIPMKTNIFEEAAKQINVPEVDKQVLYNIAKWCIEKLKNDLELKIEVDGFDSSMEHLLLLNLQKKGITVVNNYSIEFGKIYIKVTDHEFDKVENLLYLDLDQEIHRIWNEKFIESEEIIIKESKNDTCVVEIVEADIVQTETENKTLVKQVIDKWYYLVPIGVNDITGKPIREGDVLEWTNLRGNTQEHLVYYEPRSFSFLPCEVERVGTDTLKMIPNHELCKSRIIRNVHDGEVFLQEEVVEPEMTEAVQPELPVLKNNDQRKDFIDAYETWPIWIDTEITGERYYKFDFDIGTSFVIRVSLHHSWDHGKYSTEITYGCEEYFMIGVSDKYKPNNKTFHECSTNKSAMIDYLKEIQKKG